MPSLIDSAYVAARMTVPAAQAGALDGIIAAASRAVESYCHRVFGATDFLERYSSDGGRLFLRNRPVLSIASVATGRANPTTIDPARYDFDPATGEVRGVGCGDGYYPWWGGWEFGGGDLGYGGWRDVTVSYRAGYDLADMPADVQEACFLLVQSMIQGAARNPYKTGETLGPHGVTYAAPGAVGMVRGTAAGDLLMPYVTYRF
jgi:hypothetical protein